MPYRTNAKGEDVDIVVTLSVEEVIQCIRYTLEFAPEEIGQSSMEMPNGASLIDVRPIPANKTAPLISIKWTK